MENISLEGNIDVKEETVSTSSSLMSLQLKNVNVREWIQKRREGVQPWSEFFNWGKFKAPKSIAPAGARIVKNIDKFQSNYIFVFVGLFAFCILTSPMLLFAIAAVLGACFVINHRSQDQPLVVMGRELNATQQYAGVALLSIPIFLLAGAGSVIFWVLGATIFAVLLHAGFYQSDLADDELPFEVVMDKV